MSLGASMHGKVSSQRLVRGWSSHDKLAILVVGCSLGSTLVALVFILSKSKHAFLTRRHLRKLLFVSINAIMHAFTDKKQGYISVPEFTFNESILAI